ncbi:acid protease, partial [Parathielavia hyrcaniae]
MQARGIGNLYLETVDLYSFSYPEGHQFTNANHEVKNHSIATIESSSQMFQYPDGTWYPIFTGCLSFGAPDPVQEFAGGPESVNGSMIPWALKSSREIASSSFGMHYGSGAPSAKVPGSLVFGGYDRKRVVGNVLSIDGHLSTTVTLKDISIRVIQGSSPFSPASSDAATTIPNLLAQGNASISTTGFPVLIDPCSPYLTLPKSTCDAIASHLPVTYNASLGLYLWDTTSPSYDPIVSSASALSFTFMGESNTDSLDIHIPFRHLNLTLAPPFVASTPVPYFPCFTGRTGAYVLGRTFFQDAFLGTNWEKEKVWLAQAPGPNVPVTVDVVEIQLNDEGIVGGRND